MNRKQQCKACKFQNKECNEECIFAPLFPSTSDPRKFEVINTTYGLETLSFFLKDLSPQERIATVNTFYSEAGSCFDDDRVHDGPDQQVSDEPNKLIKEDKRETRQVVLALPAMSQRHLWVDPSHDDYDTEITEECPNESLEASVNAESKAN
ncbi:unnamed protein product [Cochlearia groenlandica]